MATGHLGVGATAGQARGEQLHRLAPQVAPLPAQRRQLIGRRLHDRGDAALLLGRGIDLGQAEGGHRLDALAHHLGVHLLPAAVAAAEAEAVCVGVAVPGQARADHGDDLAGGEIQVRALEHLDRQSAFAIGLEHAARGDDLSHSAAPRPA